MSSFVLLDMKVPKFIKDEIGDFEAFVMILFCIVGLGIMFVVNRTIVDPIMWLFGKRSNV